MRLLQNIYQSRYSIGLECNISSNGEFELSYAILERKRKAVVIVENGSSLKELNEFVSKYVNRLPINININGSGVLIKSFKLENDGDYKYYFNKVLPSSDFNEYYVQLNPVNNTREVFVSVSKREVVNKVLSEIEKCGVFVYGLTLGPFIVNEINEFGLLSHGEYNFAGYKVLIKNEIEYFLSERLELQSSRFYDISGQKVNSNLLISYLNALAYYLKIRGQVILPESETLLNEFHDQIRFKRNLKFGMIGMLILLFLNYAFFLLYSKKKEELMRETAGNASYTQEIKKSEEIINDKLKFLQKNVALNPIPLSFFGDEIGKSIPESMVLERVCINPYMEGSEEIQDLQIGIIKVTGYVDKSVTFDRWITDLKLKKWVKSISKVEYKYLSESDKGFFEVNISTR